MDLQPMTTVATEKGKQMSDIRLYRVMRDLEGKHCGNEYLGNLVTCGECKHWHSKDNVTYCDRINYGYGYKFDDYCSYGEVRDE